MNQRQNVNLSFKYVLPYSFVLAEPPVSPTSSASSWYVYVQWPSAKQPKVEEHNTFTHTHTHLTRKVFKCKCGTYVSYRMHLLHLSVTLSNVFLHPAQLGYVIVVKSLNVLVTLRDESPEVVLGVTVFIKCYQVNSHLRCK